jgi:hypothetical protein
MSVNSPPWATGPGEILRHGLALLKKGSDANRRLAMISVDNAVELMIKTYLGLPKRITGLSISRKDFQEIAESFPALLDALEKRGGDKIVGIDVGEIEWYHRIRNKLYHEGHGLTVERKKVEFYAQLANLLFENFFGVKLVDTISDESDLMAEMFQAFVALEGQLRCKVTAEPGRHPLALPPLLQALSNSTAFSEAELRELNELTRVRNAIVHARPSPVPITGGLIRKVQEYTDRVRAMPQLTIIVVLIQGNPHATCEVAGAGIPYGPKIQLPPLA